MALTLGRFGFVVLALAAVSLPALRNRSEPALTESEQRTGRMMQLRGRLDHARFRWSATAERDSGVRLAAMVARADVPTILLRGYPAAARSPVADTLVRRLWSAVGPIDSSVRVSMVIYNGEPYTGRQQRWGTYAGASISRTGNVISCVALIPGELREDGTVRVFRELAVRVISPCLMLAAFGAPGTGVGSWLSSTRYAAAGSVAWLNRPRGFIDGDGAPPWHTFYADWERDEEARGSLLLSTPLAFSVAQMLVPPYTLGGPGLRCLVGETTACRAGVLGTARIAERTRALQADLTFSESMLERSGSATMLDPRLPANWWLSDVARDQGREKFARFWKSDEPFDAAFQSVFGEELGAWTHRWTVRQWENSWEEKHRNQPRLLGTTLAPTWPLLVAGWTGVALLLTAWAARKRQVT